MDTSTHCQGNIEKGVLQGAGAEHAMQKGLGSSDENNDEDDNKFKDKLPRKRAKAKK
jgi:hypothetical protein